MCHGGPAGVSKIAALGLGILLAFCVPAASLAGVRSPAAVENAVRVALRGGGDSAAVSDRLEALGLTVVGHQEVRTGPGHAIDPAAGRKADLTLTMWLYEWQNQDGTYSEQAVISGRWRNTEYRLIDAPTDVIDVRWTVGDLVYVSSTPFDGVRRDQHTNGIASFTVDDQVESWDLFVNFRPVSNGVQGRWTNVFVNYTHTWMGLRLGITLGTAPQGATGTISINTDAKTWTEGTGIAFLIGSEGAWGPATAATRRQPE